MSLFSLFRGRSGRGRKILVAFASQTGAAEAIAWRSANALIGAGGFVRVAALGSLDPAALAEAGTLLVVTSTYGAGESPDSARAFVRRHMGARVNFRGLEFAVLALGDRKYDATFCQFGRGLDRWLAQCGARRLFDVVSVDGDDDDTAMGKWCEQLGKLGARCDVENLMPGAPQDWVLAARHLLNPGSVGGESWAVALTPKNPAHLHWTAGDIAEIWPRNDPGTVADFIARHDLDGETLFKWKGHWTPLATILAMSRLPADHEVAGISVQWLVERLEWLGAREYSIASLPADGRLELLVRKAVKNDGSLGLGSGWLTQTCAAGGTVSLRLRPNPNFHPPAEQDAPLPQILIGAGTGMAGLRAHLKYRAAAGRKEAWLLFGERGRGDLYYAEEIEAWRKDGTLTRADLVFSREEGSRRYVQHLVEAAGADVRELVVARGASILVCGGLEMAAGVHNALIAILGEDELDAMTQDGRYRRDIY
ncbi:MAG: flavodoxin domain-containing protein [Alphaproteobacteria bacterium]|nr:flavodoxin domain-containing protein [Alphaproteobacteria bacterium]